jgi:hypothetical protein
MGKRTSNVKRGLRAVPVEAVTAFRDAMRLRSHREATLHNIKFCRGIDHCEDCLTYERAVEAITRLLEIEPDQRHAVDGYDTECPPEMGLDAEDWENARQLHCMLASEAGIEPNRQVSIWDLDRAHINIRWIERAAFVPDGPHVGGRVRLRKWQRREVRKIYGYGNVGATAASEAKNEAEHMADLGRVYSTEGNV